MPITRAEAQRLLLSQHANSEAGAAISSSQAPPAAPSDLPSSSSDSEDPNDQPGDAHSSGDSLADITICQSTKMVPQPSTAVPDSASADMAETIEQLRLQVELLTAAKYQADQAKDALDLERQERSDRASKVTMEILERKNWSFFISGEAILSGPRNWSNWHGSVVRSLWELRLRVEDVQLVHEEVHERLLILLRSTVSQDLLSKLGDIYDFAEAVEVLRNETAGRMSQSQEIFDEKFRRFRFLPGENLHKMVLRFEDLAAEATSLGVSLTPQKKRSDLVSVVLQYFPELASSLCDRSNWFDVISHLNYMGTIAHYAKAPIPVQAPRKAASSNTARKKGGCYNCEEFGHHSNNCTKKRDVRKIEARMEAKRAAHAKRNRSSGDTSLNVMGKDNTICEYTKVDSVQHLLTQFSNHVIAPSCSTNNPPTKNPETNSSNDRCLDWLADTGASTHVVRCEEDFASGSVVDVNIRVATGNGLVTAHKKGKVVILLQESNMTINLDDVLLIPSAPINIFSVPRWDERKGILCGRKLIINKRIVATLDEKFKFQPRVISASWPASKNPNPADIVVANLEAQEPADALYQVTTYHPDVPQDLPATLTKGQLTRVMHARCGHISDASLIKTIANTRGSLIDNPRFSESWACQVCLKAKSIRFSPQDERPPVYAVMDCIHIDVANTGWTSINDCKYFVVFTDEFTKYSNAVPIPKVTKKAGDIIIEKLKVWANQTGRKPVKLMLDNGTDVNINKVKTWASHNGIVVITSPPYSPAHNGTAERTVQEVIKRMRVAIADGLPPDCWDVALPSIIDKINTVVPQNSDTSATRRWDCEIARLANREPPPVPSIGHWRPLGTRCFVKLSDAETARLHIPKINPEGLEAIVIGHEGTHVYIVYFEAWGKIHKTSDMRMTEKIPEITASLVSRPMGTLRPTKKELRPNPSHASSGGKNIFSSSMYDKDEIVAVISNDHPHAEFLYTMATYSEPNSPQQAIGMSNKWALAIDKEIEAMLSYNVFEFVEKPHGQRLIGLRWVFKIKTDGRYKARLVARGDMQREGIDYGETFASTAHSDSWRILIATATMKGRVLRQFDITAAYLHGIVQEDVYLSAPRELRDYFDRHPQLAEQFGYKPGMVIKLNRTLYGLKQSGHEWQKVLKEYLISLGFKQVPCDPATYRHDGMDVNVCTHIDDCLYDGPDEATVKRFEAQLLDRFHGQLTEVPKWLLGIRLAFNPNSVTLDQIHLIDSILEEAGMSACQPIDTPAPLPMSNPWQQRPDDPLDVAMDKVSASRYRRLVGRLMYVRVMTRPDIAVAVGLLASAFNKPRLSHGKLLSHLLRYMSATKTLRITYTAPAKLSKGPIKAYVYSDATWVDRPDAKSTSGYLIYLAGGPVLWGSKRQTVIAKSTHEAETVAMSDATSAASYVKAFAAHIGHDIELVGHADNKGALITANRPDSTSRASRHFTADHFYVRDKVADGTISLKYVDTKHQIADALTKPLSAPLVDKYNSVLFGGVDPDTPPHEAVIVADGSTVGRRGGVARRSGLPGHVVSDT
ncbi:hypothetical protein BROUX41_000002 [Berkeleyomyces rouxiae]